MIALETFALYILAATVIAITPGPGIFYVAARTLSGGRSEGIASSFGTGLGGLVHVTAGALGISALVMASATAFTTLKLLGAVYLIWLGIRTIRDARTTITADVTPMGTAKAFREGIVVEALNPKTAAFFLAFIPQFIDPTGSVALQFVVLGLISVALNTAIDVIVAYAAARARTSFVENPRLIRRLREASGAVLVGLGAMLMFTRRTA